VITLSITEQKVAALGILDRALVAASLSQPNEQGKIDGQRLDPHEVGLPNLGDSLERCTTRDSWKRVAGYPWHKGAGT
jgi:hypothetical protein